MKNPILAARYAKALYSLAKERNEQDLVFDQMRAVGEALAIPEIAEYVSSPLIRPTDRVKALEKSVAVLNISQTLKDFILLIAKKNRLPLFQDLVSAYQTISDEAHGVTRGVVRSATVLAPEERTRIAELVSKATKKQVILTYKEDPSLLGGLVAEVGSFTFDDSLTSHLQRINEQLTRSAH